jgi:hypothetical protein
MTRCMAKKDFADCSPPAAVLSVRTQPNTTELDKYFYGVLTEARVYLAAAVSTPSRV